MLGEATCLLDIWESQVQKKKKISTAQCECLVEKITVKIRIWSTTILSYSGRVQLVNPLILGSNDSVSIHLYWAQIFILSSKVIQDIEHNL